MTHFHDQQVPRVLSIAGSDSGGGAGIQADLKAFARCGVYGMTAITAITAQNTLGVTAVQVVSPEMITAQIKSVVEDIGVDAVKIGMLADSQTIHAVRDAISLFEPGTPIVVDPVMVSESGAELLEPKARADLIKCILPLATVITPNLHEARVIVDTARELTEGRLESQSADTTRELNDEQLESQRKIASPYAPARASSVPNVAGKDPSPEELVGVLYSLGPGVVVITGGHTEAKDDVFYDGVDLSVISGIRYDCCAGHGSGCTHSSVLAACLARGFSVYDAAKRAKEIAGEAVRDGLGSIGEGSGPVDVLGLAVGKET